MEYIEVSPLPEVCRKCGEGECYNCDYAGRRWVLSRRDELMTLKRLKEQAIRRLQRQLREIEEELDAL